VLELRRISALVVLATLLALPLLGMRRADTCCEHDSPCAPLRGPCASLGPVPCCSGGHAASGTSESRVPPSALGCALPGSRLLALEPERRARFERLAPRAQSSALRFSVVLRI
jgi:hypothetical protein